MCLALIRPPSDSPPSRYICGSVVFIYCSVSFPACHSYLFDAHSVLVRVHVDVIVDYIELLVILTGTEVDHQKVVEMSVQISINHKN